MNALVPLALSGWIPLTIVLFFRLKPHHAAIASVLGGTLFLPMAGYNLPGLPPFTKNSVIAIGLILGGRLSGARRSANFRWSRYDLPMLVWCLCPLASSLSNNLGLYDGVAGIWYNISMWGVPYLAGRIYIDTTEKLQELCIAFVIGGLVYMPLCLYEIRMSPQLSKMIYGFFPHDWSQHNRYGGFRPIVFMQHGLMVALWMAVTSTVACWLWRTKIIRDIKGIPFSFFVWAMIITTILCKTASGWIAMVIGIGGYVIFRFYRVVLPFRLMAILISCYMVLRIMGGIEAAGLQSLVVRVFDAERAASYSIRLVQEDLFIEKTLQRPIFGWGNIARAWPRNEKSEETLIGMIDALWLIIFSVRGAVGLFAMTTMMLIGPWRVFLFARQETSNVGFLRVGPVVLSLVVLLFMLDCLSNGMHNSVYIFVSGSLLGWSLAQERCVDV